MRLNGKSALIESGGKVVQETRLWNVNAGRTEPMRSKEFAHDYRYFPDPDLFPVAVLEPIVDRSAAMQCRNCRRRKICGSYSDYAITPYDAGVLTGSKALADYFEAAVKAGAPAKSAANWIAVELLRRLNDIGKEISECPVAPDCARGTAEASGERKDHRGERQESVCGDV